MRSALIVIVLAMVSVARAEDYDRGEARVVRLAAIKP